MTEDRNDIGAVNNIEIEPLSDEALESVAGGGSSDGPACCSCSGCSNDPQKEISG